MAINIIVYEMGRFFPDNYIVFTFYDRYNIFYFVIPKTRIRYLFFNFIYPSYIDNNTINILLRKNKWSIQSNNRKNSRY